MFSKSLLLAVLYASNTALAQVVGSATGFASGVTGGGDATPVTPTDIDELLIYLTDNEPRVILLDKTYDFSESEGVTTTTGCRPDSNTCPGDGGQDAIDAANWCSASYPAVEVTYNEASMSAIDIAGDKSIVGVGSDGVIKGKGFRLTGGISNVIIQNVHFTDFNPEYIWGGDAITLTGTDMVWIDHCKFSLMGRQMIVSGYEQAGKVTISNNEFDGTTDWSASCDGHHYWTMLFLGEADQITLQGNWVHTTSGRSPKVGGSGSITMQAVNNYWQDNTGHAFDIAEGAVVLIEGNVFDSVAQPITPQTAEDGGAVFNVPEGSEADCASYFGRDCVGNTLVDSGDFGTYADGSVLSALADAVVDAASVDTVADSVVANAGVGKLSASAADTSSNVSVEPVEVEEAEEEEEEEEVETPAPEPTATSVAPATSTVAEATATEAAPAPVETTEAASAGVAAKWFQCGGGSYTGPTACEEGTSCHEFNEWYSQCL